MAHFAQKLSPPKKEKRQKRFWRRQSCQNTPPLTPAGWLTLSRVGASSQTRWKTWTCMEFTGWVCQRAVQDHCWWCNQEFSSWVREDADGIFWESPRPTEGRRWRDDWHCSKAEVNGCLQVKSETVYSSEDWSKVGHSTAAENCFMTYKCFKQPFWHVNRLKLLCLGDKVTE